MNTNRIEFTGTIERLQQISTRSGKPMCRFLLVVGQDKFRAVCFGNLVGVVMAAGEGATVGITGTGSINNWQTEDGAWRNDFQATAWAVEIDGEVFAYHKAQEAQQDSQKVRQAHKSGQPTTNVPESANRQGAARPHHAAQTVPSGTDVPF
jgi:single-stranded DNA-binding protein